MSRHEKHAEQVKKVNQLREKLRNDPDNHKLRTLTEQEEQKLYAEELNKKDWEIEEFFRENGINTSEDDED